MNRTRQSWSLRRGWDRGFGSTWAGAGVVAAAGILCLLFFGLAAPAAGHAASDPQPLRALPLEPAGPSATSITATIFMPLIFRPEPLADNLWYAAYYDNTSLAGNPVYTAEEKRVDYDWGEGSPAAGVPTDHFSARWTGDWDFEVGNYTFFIYADNGVRLWLDGNLIVDSWQADVGLHQATRTIVDEGLHNLRLEYFEQTGGAAISLGWRRTDLYPQWRGDYYDNDPWVETTRLYRQTDTAIEFDWALGCPAGIGDCDSFSISWHATPVLEAGTQRIYIYADDGYQLYVDGTKVKEGGWYDGQGGGAQDVFYDLAVNSTQYRDVRFNFHDRGNLAEARLLIQPRGYPDWTAEYYDNRTLSGTPVKTKEEEVVFYDWGLDKPIGALPSGDSFSIRWTGQRFFHAGCYRFGLFVDDGVRLWVDGELLVDHWHDGRAAYESPYTYLATGYHDVKIEYYDRNGEAEIRFWWE